MKKNGSKNSVLAKILAGVLVGLLAVSAIALPLIYILG